MGTISRTGELACRAPFDLKHALTFLSGFTPMHGEQEICRNLLTKALMLEGQSVVFRLFQPRSDSARSAPRLRYALASDGIIDGDTERLAVDRIASFLSTDEELGPFYALAQRDAALAPVVARLRGLHHVKFPSPFEAACWGVLNQRIGMREARTMKTAIVRTIGARGACDGAVYSAFPDATRVAEYGEDGLRRLLGSDRKARAVHAVSRAFADAGEAFLRQATDDELKTWLAGIDGVGVFTTGFVLFRGFGRFERGPMSRKFTSAAERVYGRSLSVSDMHDLFGRYGRWGGHWALYVWASTFAPTSDFGVAQATTAPG
jgi:DNA-3-methyladenine glycosylase II